MDKNLILSDADIHPLAFRPMVLDPVSLGHYLDTQRLPLTVSLPMPDGSFMDFTVVEIPVMEPGLAASFPEIRTFSGRSFSGEFSLRADLTPAGFHAMISGNGTAVFIDPVSRFTTTQYLVYHKSDFRPDPLRIFEEIDPLEPPSAEISLGTNAPGHTNEFSQSPATESDGSRRTYRLAVAATGEFTTFHGGTVTAAMGAIASTINRINGIFERDLSIRLVLVNNNDQIIFTDANADPFTNNNPALLVNQSQSTLDALIGTANYDLGHTFGTGPGGLAALGVACFTGYKGQGVTGSNAPVGDPFAVDLVAHELAHQLGAHHTFNGSSGSCTTNRYAPTAFEPGSGSTIMGYAGICAGQNLQSHSDDYFHAVSQAEIFAFTVTGVGNSCPVKTVLGNNAPTANGGPDYTIPVSTPFELVGTATDPDGGLLSYNWEQYDLGASGPPDDPNKTDGPLFRSFSPTSQPSRIFPRIADILNKTTTAGEVLPGTGRTLNFLFSVRDNHPGGGRVNVDTVKVNVAGAAGPFRITSQNTPGFVWPGGTPLPITWDVAGTQAAPVNCTKVNISLSIDGGYTFPYILGSQLPNSGNAFVTVPNLDITQARIKVKAADNVFFDISDANFTIQKVVRPVVRFDKTEYLTSESEAVGADCERVKEVMIPVKVSHPPLENVVVNILVPTTSTAIQSEDYVFPQGTQITFPAGDSSTRFVSIRILDDAVYETTEILTLELRVADTTRAEAGKVFSVNVRISDDDISMTGNVPISSVTGLSHSYALGPLASVNFFDETSGQLMLSMENLGSTDWGCVWVEIDREGKGATSFQSSDTSHQYDLMDKTFFVYTENSPPAGSYRVSLYYTDEEATGWKNITGNDWSDLNIVLSPGAVSNITPDQLEPDGKVKIIRAESEGSFSGGYKVTGTFQAWAGGLGVGKTEEDTLVADSPLQVLVYPNPFSETLKVVVEGAGPATLTITSPTSGTLYRQNWDISENNQVEIPMGDLPSGIYFYSVLNGGKAEGGMLIKYP
ncbi:MAG: M12 family metallo-peptidase [Bacteroidia bacterium]|nr:M12 family metallo-peptidase [Bacteroidia bacterium]